MMKQQLLGVVALIIQSTAVAMAQHATAPSEANRPNIIFLLTDDHRWDALGAMGNPIIHTPHLDAMAQEGYLFRNAYVTTSICAVSRASLLSGQYQSRHGIADFETDFSETALAATYPMLLKAQGYSTGFIGKYGVGAQPPGNRFDFWSVWEHGQPPYWMEDGAGNPVHHTDSIDRDIALFLDRYGNSGQPFCLSVSFKAPHELDGDPPIYQVQERFKPLYADATIPPQPNEGEEAWQQTPPFFHDEAHIGRQRWEALLGTPALYQANVKNYYRLISGVDEVVGNLRAKLKSLGIDGQTVIIFMGDNGFMLGNHGLEGKWLGYEESVRVPLIIFDPNKPATAPNEVNQIALNIDIAPTILSYAQVNAPASIQGVDLRKTALAGRTTRKDLFYEHTFLGSPRIPQVEGVMGGRFKYMYYTEHGYEELFDLKRDPHELKNLAQDDAYARQLKQLRKRYKALKSAAK